MRRLWIVLWLIWAVPALAGIPATTTQTPAAGDRATDVISGQFTATGQSASILAWGNFNVVIYGSGGPNGSWNATVRLERSFDGGTTWIIAGVGGAGQQAIYSTPNQDVSVVFADPEAGMLYRLNCTAYTSGTILYRISTTAPSQSSFPGGRP